MNLIEQLGGYERAKAFVNATSYTVNELLMMQRSGLRAKHVEEALLEYRREHNIFDVGDYVLFPIACEKGGKYFGKIIDYRSDINQFEALGSRHWGWFTSSELQHATDAEIEVGHRL